jgi:hypothetical protein
MSKLDVAKEQIAYRKLWLGIMIVSDISLMGWLLGNFRAAEWSYQADNGELRHVAVLGVPPIDSGQRAAQAAVMAEGRKLYGNRDP